MHLHHVTHQALASRNITSWIACRSESSRIHWDETQFRYQTERLWDLFVQAPVHKTQFCSTTCHRFHEPRSLNHCECKCSSIIALLSGDTHMWICCVCRINDFLTDVSRLYQFYQGFSGWTWVFWVIFTSHKGKSCSKLFHIFVISCFIFNTHMGKLSSEFTVKLPVGTVFRTCLVQKRKFGC